MNIAGKLWLLLVFLNAPLAQAQGAPKKDAAPPVPSASFGPVQTAPTPAPPSTEESNSPDAPSATPEPAPRATAAPPAAPTAHPTTTSSSEVPANEAPDDEHDSQHRGARVHDGFYTRLGLGIGHVSGTTENDSSISGWGVAPDIWIGGSPVPGLAIGVTLSGVSVPNPDADISAADSGGLGRVTGEAPGTLTYSIFGLFADYYPAPTGGLHFMAGLNYSVFKFAPDTGEGSAPASGVGLFGGLGYEWWIADQWSVGPLVRLHWASVSDNGGTTSILAPVLLLGFTYH